MSIVLEATERMQAMKGMEEIVSHQAMTRDDWLDIAIALTIAFLLGVLIVKHYPNVQESKNKKITSAIMTAEKKPSSHSPVNASSDRIAAVSPRAALSVETVKPVQSQVVPSAETSAMPSPSLNHQSEYAIQHSLNGVFLSDSEKVAMIDNRFFNIGDVVDGMKIIAIHAEGVKLENESGIVELRVVM